MLDLSFIEVSLLVVVLAALVGLVLVVGVAWRRRDPLPIKSLPQDSETFFVMTALPYEPKYTPSKVIHLDAQSESWRSAFWDVGARFSAQGIGKVVYAHGTFAGDDPMGIAGLCLHLFPSLSEANHVRIREAFKASTDFLARDIGNFSRPYIQLAQEALGHNIACESFNWSSENHHFARVQGAVLLVKQLIEGRRNDGSDLPEILLVGHSHAGQVFSLLTLLRDKYHPLMPLLWAFVRKHFDMSDDELVELCALKLHYVTLGTPPRYPWSEGELSRVLHVVNHRGGNLSIGQVRSSLWTRAGDYVQSLGVAGSDLKATQPRARMANKELDLILGPGDDLVVWHRLTRPRRRLLCQGTTLLVDFRDGARRAPNFTKTIFGHGTYTRLDRMLDLHSLLAQNILYPPAGP